MNKVFTIKVSKFYVEDGKTIFSIANRLLRALGWTFVDSNTESIHPEASLVLTYGKDSFYTRQALKSGKKVRVVSDHKVKKSLLDACQLANVPLSALEIKALSV